MKEPISPVVFIKPDVLAAFNAVPIYASTLELSSQKEEYPLLEKIEVPSQSYFTFPHEITSFSVGAELHIPRFPAK
jgi:hypothetical protein